MNVNKKLSWIVIALVSCAFSITAFSTTAFAGGKIKIDDTRWISVGAELRTEYRSIEDGATSGTDRSSDFSVQDMRLNINGQVHKGIQFEFNTALDSATGGSSSGLGFDNDSARIIDAVIKFHFSDSFQVWAGQFLPPSSRTNYSGPFFINAWDYPFAALGGTAPRASGRDEGVAIWGVAANKKIKYQLGAFEGTEGAANQDDNLLYMGRLQYNLWDDESGYYNASTYYGAKDVLAIGIAGRFQEDGAGAAVATAADYEAWNVDFLLEKKLGNGGVVTLEASYYDWDQGGQGGTENEGDSWFAVASYLCPQKMGWGQIQPNVRYQEFASDNNLNRSQYDIGLNYIITGHNARLSLVYSNNDQSVGDSIDTFVVGMQIRL